MSIINDALKKTEENILKKEGRQNLPKINPEKRPLFLYGAILMAGLFLASLIFNFLGSKVPIPPASIPTSIPIQEQPAALIQPSQPVLTQKEEISVALPVEPEKADFVLNGIFLSGDSGYALINNRIAREGDLIGEARVKRITENRVEIDLDGEIIVLLNRR